MRANGRRCLTIISDVRERKPIGLWRGRSKSEPPPVLFLPFASDQVDSVDRAVAVVVRQRDLNLGEARTLERGPELLEDDAGVEVGDADVQDGGPAPLQVDEPGGKPP